VHIGHNCEIGDYSRFAAQVGIAGSVKIGRWCEFGGQTGCADNVKVGDRVRAAGKTGIPGNVPDGMTIGGYPAIDGFRWKKMSVIAAKLPEIVQRLRTVERRLEIEPAKSR
jgi:UDP-3-O-[3-hydroxymyristoyl] glucosamine N-acyltransferase